MLPMPPILPNNMIQYSTTVHKDKNLLKAKRANLVTFEAKRDFFVVLMTEFRCIPTENHVKESQKSFINHWNCHCGICNDLSIQLC